MTEMAVRIDGLESWSAEADIALQRTAQDQQKLEDKLNDLESRARRNNLRVYGVPEGTEVSPVTEFMKKFLCTELELSEDTRLQIQHAHRAPGQKPNPNSPPRSIVINFQLYSIKEMFIQKAW